MRIGRFEWKLILAMVVIAAAPLLFTLMMVDRLVEESMAVGLNKQVLSALQDEVELYKEGIESRKKIGRMQVQILQRDPDFLKAAQTGDTQALETCLRRTLESEELQRLVVSDGEKVLAKAEREDARPLDNLKSRSETVELPGGLSLEVTTVIAKDFLQRSRELRELVVTLEKVQKNFQPLKIGYYRLFLAIYTGILVAAVVLGVFLARSVTRRVKRLVEATRQAAGGDLAVRVLVPVDDEIGLLGSSFNSMLDEVQRGRDRIVFLEKVSSWQEIARRLAHEIKNPLTPIQLAIQELHRSYRGGDRSFQTKLNDSLEIVEEEVGSLRRMVETFSDFAKLPSVQPSPGELNAFVGEFLKHNPQFSVRIDFLPYPQPIAIQLDRDLMNRVLVNLITNGFEAGGPEGRVRLEVSPHGHWGVLRVSDQGPGLSPEAQQRIFQPYFTTKATGTGLGLAIVKKIVLQHEGEIQAENGPDRGAIFTVRLRRI